MKTSSAITGAAFLMATSAIGPGFLTQTSSFTADLLTSFGFVILVSILLDIGAQLNIWRIVTITNKRAQELASGLLPGLGLLLSLLIAFGGLVFNIGNIGGTGLGMNVLTGIDVKIGAVMSCSLALGIFWYKDAGKLMDHLTRILGIAMILLTVYIAFSSAPPLDTALQHTIAPERIDFLKIVTIVGGTVGGYISFAGAHRLIDAGITGIGKKKEVTRSAVTGILVTSFMRYILFLAALGVVASGKILDMSNPAASVFQLAAGNIGYKFFGFVMWCAAITSVVGASYTSVSFIKTIHPAMERNYRVVISVFILMSTIIFLWLGNPVKLLIAAGAINGWILPIALAIILVAASSKKLLGNYRHPAWLKIAGWIVVIVMAYMGWISFGEQITKLLH